MAKRRTEDEGGGYETPPILPAVTPETDPTTNPGGSLPWYGPGYHYEPPPPDSGGFWSTIGGALGDAAGALGSAAGTVVSAVETVAAPIVDVAGAVLDVAQGSVLVQAAAAAATGGLSLVVQAGAEAITGDGGPILDLAHQVVTDPLSVVSTLPGVLLTETGLPGVVADVASATGAALESALGSDSTLGGLGGKVHDGIESLQDAAESDPIASLAVIGGIAATAVGLPLGPALLGGGLTDLVDAAAGQGGQTPAPATGNTGIVPPTLPGQQLAHPESSATTSTGFPSWALALGGLVAAGAVGLAVWASNNDTEGKAAA